MPLSLTIFQLYRSTVGGENRRKASTCW